ncbi:hypothetical protein ACFXDJ_35480 [Streptomyces sp. NPDC059443]|uniref:hypothetical protein n=1 Tax=unclassified Streptomyces TaxID=2593676 RepID=UPI0036BA520E
MGSGPAPRRAAATARTTATAALLAAALLGCADTGAATPGPSTAGPPSGTQPGAPEPTPPEGLCTALITHWAGVVLDADADPGADTGHLDYQSMGLSGGQNEILLAVLADARAEQRAKGPAAARELTAREARRRCAERYRSGTPSGGPWR